MSTATEVKKEVKLRKPPKYCNVFLNNDKTPFDYVIHIFMKVFNYDMAGANKKAGEIHKNGKSVVFVSSKEACDAKFQLAELEKAKIQETSLEHIVKIYEKDGE